MNIPNSYEDIMERIFLKLQEIPELEGAGSFWLDAVTDSNVLVQAVIDNRIVFYLIDWANIEGDIVLDNVREVGIEVVVKTKNEAKISKSLTKQLIEKSEADIFLEQKSEGRCRKGRVKKAQIAEQVNVNNRWYPKAVLEKAVAEAQERIRRFGAIHMDSQHRIVNGENYRDIRETVALLDEIQYNDGIVSIGFKLVETTAGKDFEALVDGGAKFQVSQRGTGKSHLAKVNGKTVEVVDELFIDGFDFLPAGLASVREADVEFLENKEVGIDMVEKDCITKEELETILQGERERIVNNIIEELKVRVDVNSEVASTITEIQKKVEDSQKSLLEIQLKEQKMKAEKEKDAILEKIMSDEKYNRFTETQKKAMASKISVDDIYTTVGTEAFEAEVQKRFDEEVETAIKLLAEAELQKLGYQRGASTASKGRTVTVLRNEKVWMEQVDKLSSEVMRVIKRRKPSNMFVLGDDHPAMSVVNRMCERFEELNYTKLINEAGEEVTQSDIGVKVATISRVIIPVAFRQITAFDVCDVGVMQNRIENVMYSVWNTVAGAVPHANIGAIEIAEGGTIPTAGIQYLACPILANRKTLKTRVTSEAVATAKGTAMSPVEDSIANLAVDVTQRIDELLWYLMLAQAQKQAIGQVTSFETLTKQSDNVTYKSIKNGWIQYEYVKAYDNAGNPTSAKLIPLFGSTSGNTIQAIVVQHSGGGGTALVYGDDYTINYPDGSITLTTAGASKVGSNNVQAKYSYTTNMTVWSVVPPAGVSGYENLVNLRQAVGRARVKVNNRHYVPNVVGVSLATEDMISASPVFTQSGSTPADILDRLNKVTTYAGLEVAKTSALPDGWMLVFERGACIYRNFLPWTVSGAFKNTATGDDEWIGEEYSGQDVPVKDKLSLVAITDLNTIVG